MSIEYVSLLLVNNDLLEWSQVV